MIPIAFWSGNHPLTPEYDRLFKALVPAEGPCDTLQGEILRASSRIYYDYYNNGFGNDWSGAYNFLDEHLGLYASVRAALRPYRRGKVVPRAIYSEGRLEPVLEALAEQAVLRVLHDEAADDLVANPCDMFDVREKS
jgi:hypothetical protein